MAEENDDENAQEQYGKYFNDTILDRIRAFRNSPEDEQTFIHELAQKFENDKKQEENRNKWALKKVIGDTHNLKPTELLPLGFDGHNPNITENHINKFEDFLSIHGYREEEDLIHLFKLTLSGLAREWFDGQQFQTFDNMIAAFRKQFSEIKSKQDAMNKLRNISWDQKEKPFEYLNRISKITKIITPDFEFKANIFKHGLPSSAKLYISCANPRTENDLIETLERWINDNISTSNAMLTTNTDIDVIAKSALAAYKMFENSQNSKDKCNHRSRSISPYRRYMSPPKRDPSPQHRPHGVMYRTPDLAPRRRHIQPQHRPQASKEIMCYRCARMGHFAKFCRIPFAVIQREYYRHKQLPHWRTFKNTGRQYSFFNTNQNQSF